MKLVVNTVQLNFVILTELSIIQLLELKKQEITESIFALA